MQTVKSYLPKLVLLTGDVTSSQSEGVAAVGGGCNGSLGYMHGDALATLRTHHHIIIEEGRGERQKAADENILSQS